MPEQVRGGDGHEDLADRGPGERQQRPQPRRLADDELAIVLHFVAERGEGLVAGVPNRVFLRLSRPDGAVLADTLIRVSAANGARARPVEATTDADGVAELVLDPGRPTNVVVPAVPVRLPPPPPPIKVDDAQSLLTEAPVAGADATEIFVTDSWVMKQRPPIL